MFRRLSTELALVYAALFGAVMLLIAGAVWLAVEGNSRQTVRAEMAASSAVFDRLWKLRADQLAQTADVLARDFGFREAVATGDRETILSAVDNLQARFGLDAAFIVDPDGGVISRGATASGPTLLDILTSNPDASGVLMLDDAAFQAVAAPINAPTRIGWVVFGKRLGGADLGELESLSAIPLIAHLYTRTGDSPWTSIDARAGHQLQVSGAELAVRAFRDQDQTLISIPENQSIAGVKMLPSFGNEVSAALLFEYSLSVNQAHYRAMLGNIALIGVIGLVGLLFGSWIVSGRVTGPISGLRAAASRLARGELAEVRVAGRNEIAELATNFNIMSGEIAAREKRIIHLAQHDNETGLPNLRALQGRLADMRVKVEPAAIFGAAIGVDRFHHVRGAIGHALSSRLIAEISGRISSAYGELFVGRMSTDTIGVVFHAESPDAALHTITAIVDLCSQPVRLGDDRIDVVVTAGVACENDGEDTRLSLLERAEVAVEQARARRTRAAAFDREAYGDPSSALSLMGSMILGLSRNELFLAHQPKYDLRAGRIASAEALLRWRHPQRGMIPPDSFIGMAEETGHIRPLTDWVLDRAIADQRRLREGGRDIPLSINVSGRLIANEQFADRALRQIRRSGAKLCFEITETAVIDNPRLAIDVMKDLRAAGVGISIDDYGSGLSSLSYLRTIPAEELKIDKLFVQGMAQGNSDALLVKSTIDLAHSLGMTVAAEGVETADTLALLQAMGADTAQGYYIARPMPIEDFLKFEAEPVSRTAPALKGLG
ncbi:MAG TPA: EAL domain-containing protein [Hyphomonadaceae bacterium]|nr:EAL domain-containing protein [Hyphomonadaceae bacterium]